jgi:hypothetical protein
LRDGRSIAIFAASLEAAGPWAAAVRKGDAAHCGQPADPAEVAATHAFARYAVDYADKAARAREILERRLTEKRSAPGGFHPGRPAGPPTGGGRVTRKVTLKPTPPGGRRGRG